MCLIYSFLDILNIEYPKDTCMSVHAYPYVYTYKTNLFLEIYL